MSSLSSQVTSYEATSPRTPPLPSEAEVQATEPFIRLDSSASPIPVPAPHPMRWQTGRHGRAHAPYVQPESRRLENGSSSSGSLALQIMGYRNEVADLRSLVGILTCRVEASEERVGVPPSSLVFEIGRAHV